MESSDEYSTDSEYTTYDGELEYSDVFDSEDETFGSYSSSQKNEFEVNSVDDVYKDMTDVLLEASSLINLPMVPTRMLLNFFKWDISALGKSFLSEGRNSLCEKAGIPNQERSILSEPNTEKISANVFKCDLCNRQSPVSTMEHASCGHTYCTECWSSYLEKETMKRDRKQLIVCPDTKCYFPVNDIAVMKTVKDPEMEVKYKKIATIEFVECNPLMRYCTSPNCSYMIKVKYSEAERVICKCRYSFCFQCGENWHEPVSCSLLKDWNSKWMIHPKTVDWMVDNTKCCPSCKVLIEKNNGSNRVFCRSCQFNFCWLCSQKWNQLHSCNQHIDQNDVEWLISGTDDTVETAEHRLNSYWSRYINHCKSLKREKQLLHTQNLKTNSTTNLEVALESLCSLRETLIYSFIFAFYLIPSNYSSILKINHTEYEKAIERLSRDIAEHAEESRTNLKNDTENLLFYCQLRKKKVLEFIHDGNAAGWWTFFA